MRAHPRYRFCKVVSAVAAVAAVFGSSGKSANAENLAGPPPLPEAGIAAIGPADPESSARNSALISLINAVWKDATATWQIVLNASASDRVVPQINIVPKVTPSLCYGLYINSGPVYCSGNGTVFVSLDEMDRLAQRFDVDANATLAFLMAHEFGHHLQMTAGRFKILSQMIRENPQRRREYVMRFELEADCLAGVWAGRSREFAATERVKADLLHALARVGDDVQRASSAAPDPANFWHGTSEQRAHWFYLGQKAKSPDACDVLTAADF